MVNNYSARFAVIVIWFELISNLSATSGAWKAFIEAVRDDKWRAIFKDTDSHTYFG